MKSEGEIRKVFDLIDEATKRDGCLLEWKGDNFKYGFIVGKMVALGWVLGENLGLLLTNHMDFDEWAWKQSESMRQIRGPVPPGGESPRAEPHRAE